MYVLYQFWNFSKSIIKSIWKKLDTYQFFILFLLFLMFVLVLRCHVGHRFGDWRKLLMNHMRNRKQWLIATCQLWYLVQLNNIQPLYFNLTFKIKIKIVNLLFNCNNLESYPELVSNLEVKIEFGLLIEIGSLGEI